VGRRHNPNKGKTMVKTPNYGQERAQRTRVKERKQEEKQRRREENAVKRKAAREVQGSDSGKSS
jgi:hypothetical protein